MNRPELLARSFVLVAVVVAVGMPIWIWSRTSLIHARMAENGGWTPDALHAKAGEPLHLHLTSDDVMHGFAVGQTDMQSVDVEPGRVTDVTLNFDKPGTYTFYCTRWCGINHWRMRGTIEVSGPEPSPQVAVPPMYVTLGLDLDASHDALVIPGGRASATDGRQLVQHLSISEFTNIDFYRAHSPYETWKALRLKPSFSNLDDPQIWSLVAFIWQANASAEGIAEGKRLYAQNCAACHGDTGGGNGVFAAGLAVAGETAGQTMSGPSTMTMQRPADFTDPKRMLGASPALLQGKILRGGMGTGMPTWGVIFNEHQIWEIVSYLYSFQFQETP